MLTWYKASLTMDQIISGRNEEIRKDFSYVLRLLTFRNPKLFLLSVKNDRGVELFISPGSVKEMQDLIKKYDFSLDRKPKGEKISLILGDEVEFRKLFSA